MAGNSPGFSLLSKWPEPSKPDPMHTSAAAKIAVFQECGIECAVTPSDMADALIRAAARTGTKLA